MAWGAPAMADHGLQCAQRILGRRLTATAVASFSDRIIATSSFLGVLLVAFKLANSGPVGQWAWWVVLLPCVGRRLVVLGRRAATRSAAQWRRCRTRRTSAAAEHGALGTETETQALTRAGLRERGVGPIRSGRAPRRAALAALNANYAGRPACNAAPAPSARAPYQVRRRRRSGCSSRRCASMVIESPPGTSAMLPPPAWASGATWPTTMPQVPPENARR